MNLQDMIDQTMTGYAAKKAGLPLVPVTAAFRTPKPKPISAADLGGSLDEETVRRNFIWRLSWDPANPGTFTKVTIASRGMGMDYGMAATAFDSVECRRVQVTRDNGKVVDLYLDPAHMIGAWWTRSGKIPDSSQGLWRLAARLDASIVVMFGYNLDADSPSPLDQAACDELGNALVPTAGGAPPPGVEVYAAANTSIWVCVGEARYIVAVELALHREENNFVPGGFIGFARIHPHVMLWSNEDLVSAQASIVLDRPAHGMSHGAMKSEHKILVVADTNVEHDMSAQIKMPLPFTDLLYDYFETSPYSKFKRRTKKPGDHPLTEKGEITLADPRFKRGRILEKKIKRNTPWIGSADPDIYKEPRQGQFDNVHIAPRMTLEYDEFGKITTFDEIVMINTCLHDCTHMHVRWSAFFPDKILAGWKNGEPHVEPGAPGVPENQVVFASFPNSHALCYRAVASKIPAGKPFVVMHHGLAYAVDEWPTGEAHMALKVMRGTIEQLANQIGEPASKGTPNDTWASFYFRVRYTGYDTWVQERSEFDVEECMP